MGELMPLLNYTTKISAIKTANQIVEILAKHRATSVMMDYDGQGAVTGIKWRIESNNDSLGFALPVNVDAVFQVMTKQRISLTDAVKRRAQSERTAWRNIKDWVEAQMALIETGQAPLEQIFLPYMLNDAGETFYHALAETGFKALPAAGEEWSK